MEIVYRDLSTIKQNPNNPRKAKEHGIEELAESIKSHPDYFEARPILLSDRTGELVIVGGNRRYDAAQYLGLSKCPTILIPNLDVDTENELMLLDNLHVGVFTEAVEKLLKKWDTSKKKTWGVELPKWDKPAKSTQEDNFDSEGAIEVRCKRGDVWELGEHKLMCGDSIELTDVQTLIGGGK